MTGACVQSSGIAEERPSAGERDQHPSCMKKQDYLRRNTIASSAARLYRLAVAHSIFM